MEYRQVTLKVYHEMGCRVGWSEYKNIKLPYDEIWTDGDIISIDRFEALERKYAIIN